MNMQKAAFLDRDGIINVDHGYVYKPEDFSFVPNFPDLAYRLKKLDYLLIVVTNQSGVARGLYNLEDVQAFHNLIQTNLYREVGIKIDDFFVCPHHPKGTDHQFSIACECRKPKPGLIDQAIQKFDINLTESFVLGDKASDIELAKKVGIKGFQLINGLYSTHPDADGYITSLKDFNPPNAK